MVKRNKWIFERAGVIETEEHHDGRYGAPGEARIKKKKPTKEQMRIINAMNKAKRCRHRLLLYFCHGDILATWTYAKRNRPPNMAAALKDFQDAMRRVKEVYRKRGKTCYWIRNIERGTKGAWHIHLVINEIGDTGSIIQKAWGKGGTWMTEIRKSEFYDEDFSQLANYMTKDEYTVELKKDGTPGKPKIKEASYNTSRNMPLPEPKSKKLIRWKKEVKPPKGYYIEKIYEGINKAGFRYRHCTFVKIPEPHRRN